MLHTPQLNGQTTLAVDQTGVGRPVVDLLRAQGLCPLAITITGGQAAHGTGQDWHVPKADLVTTLQVLLQSQRLKFAATVPEAQTLISELVNYQVKKTEHAHETFNAREGQHDDLVLALAIATWAAERPSQAAVIIPTVSYKR